MNQFNFCLLSSRLDSGAGDTFNGVVIHCLHKGLEIEEAVDFACLVASKKLEMHGIKALKGILPQLLPSRVFQ